MLTFFFWRADGNWALYALLLLAPDIGMLGYVVGYGLKYPWAPFKETHLDRV